jgi:hypothetical protein
MHHIQYIATVVRPHIRASSMMHAARLAYACLAAGRYAEAQFEYQQVALWEGASWQIYYNRTGIDEGQATKGQFDDDANMP